MRFLLTCSLSVSVFIGAVPLTQADSESAGHRIVDGAASLVGTPRADILSGSDGDDIISGGAGDDVLVGGLGLDRLFGGTGADQFVFEINQSDIDAVDEVEDFDPAEGDSVVIQWRHHRGKGLSRDTIRINHRGDLSVKLDDGSWRPLARLKQSELKFEAEQRNNRVFLKFKKTLR